MMDLFHSYNLLSVILDIALGAVMALIYNWALGLKWARY